MAGHQRDKLNVRLLIQNGKEKKEKSDKVVR